MIRVAAILALAACGLAIDARADEIRLKDGKKLYGVIVAYEDNMFKVKTDFGYVLVERDKIASIIPASPGPAGAKREPSAASKKETPSEGKAQPDSQTGSNSPSFNPPASSAETALSGGAPSASASTEVKTARADSKKSSVDPAKPEKALPKISNAAVRPALPASQKITNAPAPSLKASSAAPTTTLTPVAKPEAPPKEADVASNREAIQGNSYTNYTHGFRMYKAPSWNILEEARGTLPNAIVALGTSTQSTLMVVGQEKTKEHLDAAAKTVEKRLHEIYENYQLASQRKTAVGGLPAVEYRYRGMADEHQWSGTLVVVARGNDIFTVLGMTYADTDLIQIQENVIARTIGSLDFSVR